MDTAHNNSKTKWLLVWCFTASSLLIQDCKKRGPEGISLSPTTIRRTGHTEASQQNKSPDDKAPSTVKSELSSSPTETGRETKSNGSDKQTLNKEPETFLPALSGFSGMDPDTFPPGVEGLDQIVSLWVKTVEKIKKEVEEEEGFAEGKTPIDPVKIMKCLPAKIAGWKPIGKADGRVIIQNESEIPMATRSFHLKGRKEIKAVITIMDTLNAPGVKVGFKMGLIITKNAPNSTQQLININQQEGYAIVRSINESSQPSGKMFVSKGALMASKRFLIVVSIDNLNDIGEVERLISQVNIGKLIKMNSL